jgi:hypothetical protein
VHAAVDVSPECAYGEFRGEKRNAEAILLFLPQIAAGHLGEAALAANGKCR